MMETNKKKCLNDKDTDGDTSHVDYRSTNVDDKFQTKIAHFSL